MSRCRSLGVMIGTRLGIYVQIDKHTAGPPVDTAVEILSPHISRTSCVVRVTYLETPTQAV
ncbi:hypothetical protein ACTXT7_009512 [Hymenolepis weldensis]